MRQNSPTSHLTIHSWAKCAFLCIVGLAVAPVISRAGVGTTDSREAIHIGVIGEAARPGVYQIKRGTPTVGDILNRAGGMTRRANGSVRIVRGNRLSHMLYIGTDNQGEARLAELHDGDVLVVDRFASRNHTVQTSVNAEAEPIPVALVGLKSHPVVIPVPQTYAYPAAIVAYLGQSPQMAFRVRIASTSFSQTRRDQNTVQFSGPTVVSFDGLSIDAKSLPKLPAVFTADVAEPATLYNGESVHPQPTELPTPSLSWVDDNTELPRLVAPESNISEPLPSGPALRTPAVTPPEEPSLIRQIRKIEEAQAERHSEEAANAFAAEAKEAPQTPTSKRLSDDQKADVPASNSLAESWRMWKWVAGVTGVFLAVTFVLVRASGRWNATRTAAKTQIRVDRPHQTVEEMLRGPHFAPKPQPTADALPKSKTTPPQKNETPTVATTQSQPTQVPAVNSPKSVANTRIPLPKPKFAAPRAVRHTTRDSSADQPTTERSRFDDALANLSDAA